MNWKIRLGRSILLYIGWICDLILGHSRKLVLTNPIDFLYFSQRGELSDLGKHYY